MHRIAVDVGGTFTDLVATTDSGKLTEVKVPSNREGPDLALKDGLGELAATLGYADIRGLLVETSLVIQGTTVALNALLQGNGAKTGLLCTSGFRDTLAIRLGYKEKRYEFAYQPPPDLVPRHRRLPIRERVDKSGEVVEALLVEDVDRAVAVLREEGVEAVAVCFLWSFLNPAHERLAAEIVHDALPDVYVAMSSSVLPKIREYNRTSTTVINAYVGPIVRRYVESTERMLRRQGLTGRIRYVQSNGGLAEGREVKQTPVHLLMSGPAAAPAAGMQFSELSGKNFITLDMGGTSFDACLVNDGLPQMRDVIDIKSYRVAVHLIDVNTIGAGGGSIAQLDAGLLRVGPESAEAVPGPACYRQGGIDPTVTDANVTAGLLNPHELLGGRLKIDRTLAEAAIDRVLVPEVDTELGRAARGLLDVACRDMAESIREITVRQGFDPRDYALLVGGGAGGLHATQLAEELGVRSIIIPQIAASLCAYGAIVADIRHDYTRSYVGDMRTIDLRRLREIFEELETTGKGALDEEGVLATDTVTARSIDLRYKDQVYECSIDVSDLETADDETIRGEIQRRFDQRHQELYDFAQPGYPCQVVSSHVTVVGKTRKYPPGTSVAKDAVRAQTQPVVRSALFRRDADPIDARVYQPEQIPVRRQLVGPIIIEEPNTTIVVPDGWAVSYEPAVAAYWLQPNSS